MDSAQAPAKKEVSIKHIYAHGTHIDPDRATHMYGTLFVPNGFKLIKAIDTYRHRLTDIKPV